MQTKTVLLLLFGLAIMSCKSDFVSKTLSIATGFGKIEARLNALEEKTIESRNLYFVYGNVAIENASDRNIGVDLNDIVLTVSGRNSESCYIDSVASFVSPLDVLKSEKKTFNVYWVFDRKSDMGVRQIPEISVQYRE